MFDPSVFLEEGAIVYFQCSHCDCFLYNFSITADVDYASTGLVSLAQINQKAFAFVEATSAEWTNLDSDGIALRINKVLNTKGFVYLEYANFPNDSGGKDTYPQCPNCSHKLTVKSKLKVKDFKAKGGSYYVIDADNQVG